MAKRRSNGEGSVREKPGGTWEARYTDPNGKQKSITGATESEVRKKLVEIIHNMNQGDYVEPTKETLASWIETWLKLYKLPKLKAQSYFNYFKMYSLYIKNNKLGAMIIGDIRQNHVQEFINAMAKDYSKATVRYVYTVLNAALEKAANPSTAMIRRNPAKGIEWPKFKKAESRKNVLSADEQKRLEAVLPGRYLSDVIELMLCTGLRPGEALGLQWKDVDLKKLTLNICGNRMLIGQVDDEMEAAGYIMTDQDTTKSASSDRVIPMNYAMYRLLYRMKTNRQNITYVCVGHDKQPTTIHILRGALSRSLKKAGIDDVSPHKLRHSFATRCIENGMNPKALQKILGHATLAQTMDLYVNPTDDYLAEELYRMDYAMNE